jgi:hypothetical protein
MRLRTTSFAFVAATVLAVTTAVSAAAAPRPSAVTPRAVLGYELHVPAFTVANENASATAVGCTLAGYCLAVGFFARSSAHPSLALTWVRTTTGWHAGSTVALPVGAGSTATSSLGSVSCASPGNCLAVGTYKASATSASTVLAVRVRGGIVERGVAIAAPRGLRNPVPFAWCSASGACEVAGTATNAANKGRLFAFAASLSASAVWHSAAVAVPYATPSGLPTPNNGGSLTATDFTCVTPARCILVGSLQWTATSGTLPFSEVQSGAAWATARRAPLPSDSLPLTNPNGGGSLNSLSCAGAPTSFAASHCIAVGTYDSTAGPRQLEVKALGGSVSLGDAIALPTEGVYLATACRSANLVCVATGYTQFEGEAGAGSAYSVGTWTGFTSASGAPLVVGGGDPFDWLTGAACLAGKTTCVATGQGVDNADNDPIVLTFTGLP